MQIVENWRSAWRWYSVNCPAMAVALLSTWTALPAEMQATFTPDELKVSAISLIVLGIGGRFIDQKKGGPGEAPDQV